MSQSTLSAKLPPTSTPMAFIDRTSQTPPLFGGAQQPFSPFLSAAIQTFDRSLRKRATFHTLSKTNRGR
jgi:hypothetical protein